MNIIVQKMTFSGPKNIGSHLIRVKNKSILIIIHIFYSQLPINPTLQKLKILVCLSLKCEYITSRNFPRPD